MILNKIIIFFILFPRLNSLNISINDVLENGEKVYGLVKINGLNVNGQCKYNLGKNLVFEGGSNILIYDKNVSYKSTLKLNSCNKELLSKKHNELYHLLTDTKTFFIEDIKFYDYNAAIDLLLEKNK